MTRIETSTEIRDEALRLIRRFVRKHPSSHETVPELLQYYFGGSRRHWGNVLANGAEPSKVDIACLRASVEQDGGHLRRISGELRRCASGKARNDWNFVDLFSPNPSAAPKCKGPLARRDGGIYERDSWKLWEDFS